MTALLLAAALAVARTTEIDFARAEFAKYHRQACGSDVAPDVLSFAIDPKVSANGNDAYRIRSEGDKVRIVGSNGRSCIYAVYDLLERRAGCRWFWDGDIVPQTNRIDLSGLDVREEARFEFRGLRYFAHRGLTRFQAEHWGLEDWKREIDWCLKKRLNLIMLRIGQDDLFQKAFPDVVDYPDPAKPLPEAMPGYDNRTLFWPLQYRGELRRALQQYAFDRGLQIPEDFGTMSHWYSRTPYQFLRKLNPPFLPQQGGCYGHETDRVWDVLERRWFDAYWKITEASIANYGRPGLLHTVGLGERHCYTNRADDIAMKISMLKLTMQNALEHYPDARFLLAGWDFWNSWRPEEVRTLFPQLDPKNSILWDYEADAPRDWAPNCPKGKGNDFTQWNVVGKFPYAFGIFESFEAALDPRADYALIEERFAAAAHDPMCRAYIYWPEASHVDAFMLDYFPAVAWKGDEVTYENRMGGFCRDRYGRDAAALERIWRKVQPAARMLGWGGNCGSAFCEPWGDCVTLDGEDNGEGDAGVRARRTKMAEDFPFDAAADVFATLGSVDVGNPQVKRDAVDLARTFVDRMILAARVRLLDRWNAWRKGEADAGEVRRLAVEYVRLGELLKDVLAQHTDYSLNDSLARLKAVEPVPNPDFEHVLVDNAVNFYCRSHQYEAAAELYLPQMKRLAGEIEGRVGKSDKGPIDTKAFNQAFEELRAAMLKRPLAEMAPCAVRSEKSWRGLMKTVARGFGGGTCR